MNWSRRVVGPVLGLGIGAAFVFFGLSFACTSGSNNDLDGGNELDGGRATASPCPTRPPGFPANDAGCTSDQECTAGLNGRCNGCAGFYYLPGGAHMDAACLPNTCSYDECKSDETCNGFACLCSDTFPLLQDGTNKCAKSGCRVNSDCASGFACAPTPRGFLCAGYPVGYFCRTALDTCTHDTDCPNGGVCAFNGNGWVCASYCIDS